MSDYLLNVAEEINLRTHSAVNWLYHFLISKCKLTYPMQIGVLGLLTGMMLPDPEKEFIELVTGRDYPSLAAWGYELAYAVVATLIGYTLLTCAWSVLEHKRYINFAFSLSILAWSIVIGIILSMLFILYLVYNKDLGDYRNVLRPVNGWGIAYICLIHSNHGPRERKKRALRKHKSLLQHLRERLGIAAPKPA